MWRWVVYGLVFLFLLAALGFWGVRTFQSKVSGDSAFWESAIVDFEESDALRPPAPGSPPDADWPGSGPLGGSEPQIQAEPGPGVRGFPRVLFRDPPPPERSRE